MPTNQWTKVHYGRAPSAVQVLSAVGIVHRFSMRLLQYTFCFAADICNDAEFEKLNLPNCDDYHFVYLMRVSLAMVAPSETQQERDFWRDNFGRQLKFDSDPDYVASIEYR